MAPMKIAVVGAQGTGKTTLVDTLRIALCADTAVTECSVSESRAWEQRNNFDLTLLMGLDLPPQARANSAVAAQHDAQLRQLLNQCAIVYAVVYGMGEARTDCALQAIAYHRLQSQWRRRPVPSAWQWCCNTCSDAVSEHRLFSALVNDKASVRP